MGWMLTARGKDGLVRLVMEFEVMEAGRVVTPGMWHFYLLHSIEDAK